MVLKRVGTGIAVAAAAAGIMFATGAATMGTASADPWKCESGNNCYWGPGGRGADWRGPGDWDRGAWDNKIPWGHLPEGWH
ncbi:hypothetical protein [Mycobacteroides abscessus]